MEEAQCFSTCEEDPFEGVFLAEQRCVTLMIAMQCMQNKLKLFWGWVSFAFYLFV